MIAIAISVPSFLPRSRLTLLQGFSLSELWVTSSSRFCKSSWEEASSPSIYLFQRMSGGIYLFLNLGGKAVAMFASIISAFQALSTLLHNHSTTPGDLPETCSRTHLTSGIDIQPLLCLCSLQNCGGCVHLSKPNQGWVGFHHTVMRKKGLHQSFSGCSDEAL